MNDEWLWHGDRYNDEKRKRTELEYRGYTIKLRFAGYRVCFGAYQEVFYHDLASAKAAIDKEEVSK